MRLPKNHFLANLSLRKQLGLWVSMSSNVSAEVISPSQYDWVLVDMEHSPNDLQSVLSQLQVFESYPTTAVVRPRWNDPVVVKGLLDLGVQTLMFPMIQNADEAALAVASTRYPPQGIRGVAGSSRATRFGRIKNYPKLADSQIAVIVQLETQEALDNAEAIAAVDGVDAVFFGPGDIAADMGMVGQPLADPVWAAITPVAERLMQKGVPIGTLVLNPEFAAKLLNSGFSFVACGADTALLASASDALLAKVNSLLNDDLLDEKSRHKSS